ncbi:MAG TPA: hypothetical protein VM241_01295 [Candidatus Thermoplasmatota archaeon]|nr:hypothetical protein [Candidatus Thermoplasmatota archaeon]
MAAWQKGAIWVVLACCALAQPTVADHIAWMTVSQPGANGNEVTLRFDLQATGKPHGGTIQFSTGDGRSGSLGDGIVEGTYAGDDSGTGTFSGGTFPLLTFSWVRTQGVLGNVQTDVTYTYGASGTYTLAWSDCCHEASGVKQVKTDNVPLFGGPSLGIGDFGTGTDPTGGHLHHYGTDAKCSGTTVDEANTGLVLYRAKAFCEIELQFGVRVETDVDMTQQPHTRVYVFGQLVYSF